MSNDRAFHVNGKPQDEKKHSSLPDRQRKANEAVAGIMDQINELLAKAEKQLKALQPSHDASLVYKSDSWDNYEWESHRCIGFVKYEDHRHPSGWRICHRSYEESVLSGECRGETGWKPLSDCPRWVRVEVALLFPKLLPKLQEELVKVTEDFVPQASRALAALQKALAQEV